MPVRRAALPPGFVWVERGEIVAAVEAELEPALRASPLLSPGGFESLLIAGSSPTAREGPPPSARTGSPGELSPSPGAAGPEAPRFSGPVATGRGRTAVLSLDGVGGAGRRLLLRPVLHGGLLGPLLGGALTGLRRPREELRVTAALRGAGAPVPRPALFVARRVCGPIFCAAVATDLEEGAVDAAAFLASQPERPRMLRAAAALGASVRRFHDRGGRHADLHVKNLLLREHPDGFDARIVDLDRARSGGVVGERRRMRELMRLYRSLRKRGLAETVGRRGCARFFAAYVQGDRTLRRALLAHLPRERLRVSLHALAYRRERGRW